MSAPHETWTVLPHEKLIALEDNLMTVVGHLKMPAGELPRRMTVVRLRDRRLVIYSAIALDEHEMHELEDFGTPAFLIVPNDHHRLDAKIWKDRYPEIRVITPEGAREKVAKVVQVDAAGTDFGDPDFRMVAVPGTQLREVALEVSGGSGLSLVLNDVVANIHDAKGFGGWLLKVMGFAGDEPHVPGPIKAMIVKDKAALARQLRLWSETPRLKRIIVSHGDIIEDGPKSALIALARQLED